MGKIFSNFTNSKVASHKVLNDSHNGGLGLNKFGSNSDKTGIGLASKTKAAINPTSDADDHPRAKGLSTGYSGRSGGGASGDGATPGYDGSGAGIDQLNNAHGNDAKRKLNYGH